MSARLVEFFTNIQAWLLQQSQSSHISHDITRGNQHILTALARLQACATQSAFDKSKQHNEALEDQRLELQRRLNAAEVDLAKTQTALMAATTSKGIILADANSLQDKYRAVSVKLDEALARMGNTESQKQNCEDRQVVLGSSRLCSVGLDADVQALVKNPRNA